MIRHMASAKKNRAFPDQLLNFDSDSIVSTHVNGFDDPALTSKVVLGGPSALTDLQQQRESAEAAYIADYLDAFQILEKRCVEVARSTLGVKKPFTRSLLIPFLFMARHLVELVLKAAIEQCGRGSKPSHRIVGLWQKLRPLVRDRFSEKELGALQAFVEFLARMDEAGTTFRYATELHKDKKKAGVDNGLSVSELRLIEPTVLGDRIRDFVEVFHSRSLIPSNRLDDFDAVEYGDAIFVGTKEEFGR
jgi:hypothetical protein